MSKDSSVENVDVRGSEHHVRTHINEPPGLNLLAFFDNKKIIFLVNIIVK